MPHAYTADQLVEQPAIGLFAVLGWPPVSMLEETFGATGRLLRETNGKVGKITNALSHEPELSKRGRRHQKIPQVGPPAPQAFLVLVSRSRVALGRFNPAFPPEATTAAVDQ